MLRISPDFTGTVFDFDPSSIPQCQVNTMMDTRRVVCELG